MSMSMSMGEYNCLSDSRVIRKLYISPTEARRVTMTKVNQCKRVLI